MQMKTSTYLLWVSARFLFCGIVAGCIRDDAVLVGVDRGGVDGVALGGVGQDAERVAGV